MAFNMFKKKSKQDYVLNVLMIVDLVGYDGKDVVLKWRRGKKDGNKGKFKPIKMSGPRTPVTDATLNLHCTLFEKAKAGFYEEKLVQFILETANAKKICAGVIDLAQFADLDGKKEETIFEMRAKGKALKAKLMISIVSSQGVSTGESENTECLVLDSEEDTSTNARTDPIHASLIHQMKAKEEKEEELLRKKQMKERDEMLKNEKLQRSEESPVADTFDDFINTEVQPIQVEEPKQEIIVQKPKEIEEVKEIFNNKEHITNEEFFEMFDSYDEEDAVRFIVFKFVEKNTKDITSIIDLCMFSNRSVFDYNTTDIEQVNALKLIREVKHIYDILEERGIEEEVITLTIRQTYHFIAYYILDTLFAQPEKICCSRGFQIKYVMSYMDMYSNQKEFEPIREEYPIMNVVTDIANVFILHHVIAVNDVETTFPSLSINIIYQLLSNFHTDEMDPEPVSQGYLRSIQNKCTNDPIPTRLTFVD